MTFSGTAPIAYTYQWLRNGSPITGATGTTYTTVSADAGSTISCAVTATNSFGTVTATTAATGTIVNPGPPLIAPTVVVAPTITAASYAQGQTLAGNPGSWNGNEAPVFTYQWKRDGTAIPFATATTYLLSAADVGHAMTWTVTATNSQGTASSTTAATPVIIGPPGTFSFGLNAAGNSNFGPFPPRISNAEFDFYKLKGAVRIRLPIQLEFIYPTLMGALDPTELAAIQSQVTYCTSIGMQCSIDPHYFGRWNGNVLGSAGFPIAAFADFWGKMATVFASNPKVAFDLGNEPNNQSLTDLINGSIAAIQAIRANGFTGKIYAEGLGYSGAWNWTNNNPGFEAVPQSDPQLNTIVSAHLYMDHDSSGTGFNYDAEVANTNGVAGWPTSPAVAVNRASVFVNWLNQYGFKGHIGEFGIPNNDTRWLTAARNGLTYFQASGLEVDIWAAGPAWGAYPQSIETYLGRQARQWPLLQDFSGSTDQPTVWFCDGPTRASAGGSAVFSVDYRGRLPAPVTFTVTLTGGTTGSITLSGDNPTGTITLTMPAGLVTYQVVYTNSGGLTNPPSTVLTTESDILSTNGIDPTTAVNIVNPQRQVVATYYGPLVRLLAADTTQQDFYPAGQAYGAANVGRELDYSAVATWLAAHGGTAQVALVYNQSLTGATGNIRPATSENRTPSTTEYPTYSVNGNGKVIMTWSTASRMDMTSPLGTVANTQIVVANHVGGSGMMSWKFNNWPLVLGPNVTQFWNGPTNVTGLNEAGVMAWDMTPGELHVHAHRWKAASVDGWKTWKDGTVVAYNRTYSTGLAMDYGRTECNLGWYRFGGNTWQGDIAAIYVFNTNLTDAQCVAIQNSETTFNATIPAALPSVYIDANFKAGTYTVGGSSVALSTILTTTGTIDANGLLVDSTHTATWTGALLSAIQNGTFTIVLDIKYVGGTNGFFFAPRDTAGTSGYTYFINGNVAGQLFGSGWTGGTSWFWPGPAAGDFLRFVMSNGTKNTMSYDYRAYSYVDSNPITFNLTNSVASNASSGTSYYIERIRVFQSEVRGDRFFDLCDSVNETKGVNLPTFSPGVNLGGGAFQGVTLYSDDTELDYWIDRLGPNGNMRINTLMERLIPTINGPFSATDIAALDRQVTRITNAGLIAIVDFHNYGSGYGYAIGSANFTATQYANTVAAVLGRYPGNPKVFFSHNEPVAGQTLTDWVTYQNQACAAARATGWTGTYLFTGTGNYSSADGFVSSGNAAALLSATDSGNNYAFELHKYYDAGSSGSHPGGISRYAGSNGYRAAIAWARRNGKRLWIGETNGDSDPNQAIAVHEVRRALSTLYASRDVVLGYSMFAAGKGWVDSYFMLLTPGQQLSPRRGPATTNDWTSLPLGEKWQTGLMRTQMT